MSVREIIAVPIALISVLFLLLVVTFPILLIEQASKDDGRLHELMHVQAYIDRSIYSGRSLPTDDELQHWAKEQRLNLAPSVSTTPISCLNDFSKLPQDRYVVGFWVGEWSECLSSPTGATTLQPTVFGLLKSGLWIDLLLYLTLGLGFGWTAWILGLRQSRNGS